MLRFAIRAVRARALSYVPSAAVVLVGAALLTAFGALYETGTSATGHDHTTLTLLPLILGGWTLAIVAYGIVSTVALSIQQRERETALLRTIAATPGQVRRGLIAEVLVVAAPAVLGGLLPGLLIGRGILAALSAFGAVGPVSAHTGWRSMVVGTVTALGAALAAAIVASRRAARISPVRALAAAGDAPARTVLGKPRAVAALALFSVGLVMGVTTLFMPDGPLLSSTAGPGGVAAAVGLALVCPVVARSSRLLAVLARGAGRLGARNMAARATATAAVISPLVLLVGIAAGTLYMQSTEDSLGETGSDASRIAPVNYLVVLMITAFALIAAGNALIAATRHRGPELRLLRLVGATRGQVLRMIAFESTVSAVLALLLGTVAAAVMAVPYSVVRIGSPVPAGSPWIYAGTSAAVLIISVAVAVGTATRLTRLPSAHSHG
ncbi:MAG TPA: FtsX-like permease family protein [Actinocatenispora sp.]